KATRSKFAHSLTNHPANELLCRVFSPSRRPQLNCFDPGWRHPVARGFRSDRSPARMWDMAAIENAKVTIVGAGSVGSATAYATLIRGAARDVVLYDIDAARVEAEALDLAHSAMFTGSSSIVGSADIAATAGSNVIVVTAGAAQRPGQTRLELIDTNARIFRSMIPQLLDASPDAIVIIVTNPCDVLTFLAVEQTGIDPARLFASGCVLDTSRLRWLLAERAGVAARSVHAHIVGEHGDSEFPPWPSAAIGPVPLLEWTRNGERVFNPRRPRRHRDPRAHGGLQGHRGQGIHELRDRPVGHAHHRGGAARRARDPARLARAARLPRRRQHRD